MKRLHLICNSHLDPVWQWQWEEGISAALSTFQSAVNLAEEFDYIFCHNEAILYQAVEQHAPVLFNRIQELVREGKWHIMGGWWLQPDCNMPSGESIVRQNMVGHRYFYEKFGVWPATAVNFDSFGHNRGLVQILTKCGQDSYMFVRPFNNQLVPGLPQGEKNSPMYERFWWQGYDGSRVKAARNASYMTFMGHGGSRIAEVESETHHYDVGYLLWGVGNHGGGPSRNDLTAIKAAQQSGRDYEIIHSTPEQYFAEVTPELTETVDHSMLISMPGCYTSMSRIKRGHIELENRLYMAEKIASLASLKKLIEYPTAELEEAQEALLTAEFHDMLPGTAVKSAEEYGLSMLGHGNYLCRTVFTRALYALSLEEPVAGEGEYPLVVFNPHPYPVTETVWCEVMPAGPRDIEKHEKYRYRLEKNGVEVPVQMAKAKVNMNNKNNARLTAAFTVTLPAFSTERYSMYIDLAPYKAATDTAVEEYCDLFPAKPLTEDYTYTDANKTVTVGKNGLLTRFEIGGVNYIRDGGFLPVLYEDNADPWGMSEEQLLGMGKDPKPLSLMQEAKGMFRHLSAVQLIEDGPIFTEIESLFEGGEATKVCLRYTIYKQTDVVDVKASVLFGEREKMLKLLLPVAVKGDYIGQGMFGTESLFTDGRECVAQRFVAVKPNKGNCLAILNRSQYGSSYEDGTVALSLLRGAGYCSHPNGEHELLPRNRFVDIMDQGEHDFYFRLAVCPENRLETEAALFNQRPYALNLFPTKDRTMFCQPCAFSVSNAAIAMPAFKYSDLQGGYIIRLLNNSPQKAETDVTMNGVKITLNFGAYEAKTLLWKDSAFSEQNRLEI